MHWVVATNVSWQTDRPNMFACKQYWSIHLGHCGFVIPKKKRIHKTTYKRDCDANAGHADVVLAKKRGT